MIKCWHFSFGQMNSFTSLATTICKFKYSNLDFGFFD